MITYYIQVIRSIQRKFLTKYFTITRFLVNALNLITRLAENMVLIKDNFDINILEIEAAARGIANIQRYFNMSIGLLTDGIINEPNEGEFFPLQMSGFNFTFRDHVKHEYLDMISCLYMFVTFIIFSISSLVKFDHYRDTRAFILDPCIQGIFLKN